MPCVCFMDACGWFMKMGAFLYALMVFVSIYLYIYVFSSFIFIFSAHKYKNGAGGFSYKSRWTLLQLFTQAILLGNSVKSKNYTTESKLNSLHFICVHICVYFCGLWPLMNPLPLGWIKYVFKHRWVWGYYMLWVMVQRTRRLKVLCGSKLWNWRYSDVLNLPFMDFL